MVGKKFRILCNFFDNVTYLQVKVISSVSLKLNTCMHDLAGRLLAGVVATIRRNPESFKCLIPSIASAGQILRPR